MGQLTVVHFKIASGQANSNEQDLRGFRLRAIQMPTTWTAADLAFFSRPGLAPGDAGQGGNDASQLAFQIVAAVSTYRVLTSAEFRMAEACAFVTLRSASNGSPPTGVNQGGDRVLVAVVEPR